MQAKTSRIAPYIALMRPYQWVKNIFIFAPAFFALSLNFHNIFTLIALFMGFSLIASAIYVFNDIFDRKADSLHPTKKLRPIASGEISLLNAVIFMLMLFAGGGGGNMFRNTIFIAS